MEIYIVAILGFIYIISFNISFNCSSSAVYRLISKTWQLLFLLMLPSILHLIRHLAMTPSPQGEGYAIIFLDK